MNTIPTPSEHDIQAALEQLSRDDIHALIQHMVQLHPDLAGLIVSKQPTSTLKLRTPFKAEIYRLQVEKIFYTTDRNTWGAEARAAEPLLDIVDIADDYVQQQDFTDAAVLYEIIIRGILENYDTFRWHADEGDLDEVVEGCVEGMGKCLLGELRDTAVRKQIMKVLFNVYEFDEGLYFDEPVMSRKVPPILVRWTTADERRILASCVRGTFDLDIDWYADNVSKDYDDFLLGLEADTIDDETFLHICRVTESYNYLVERLLKLGRLEEALTEAQHVEDYDILEIADIFCEHGHEATAVHLIEEREKSSLDTDLSKWLKECYQGRGNVAGALNMTIRIFQSYPFETTIERFKEIRHLAQQLNQWETVRSEVMAYLKQSHNRALQIEIALDEGQIELALKLLVSGKQTGSSGSGPYGSGNFKVGIEVAKAAEESHPQESIEIYQRYVETLIEWRGRENYHVACQYLTSVRKLYQKVGKSDEWTNYIADLRERNARLPALKNEMAKAKL
jgi:hypothetical protein